MGVMRCARNACENVMCDTYVDEVGYVCNDCQAEFKIHVTHEKRTDFISENEIAEALKEFIQTRKSANTVDRIMTVDEFFNAHTDN